ncbi:hypothetical protein ABZ135_13250 [Streptomyces sp. NPDC006339]|uniref:hypothetical protein n=1 Tax=Streptomyces sp. NPDC006339 TaxID=3156755 RepID=UPI0033A4AC9D
MSGRTHRTRLARAFATAQSMAYQKALAHVIACSEAGLLPSRLDRQGMEKALAVLHQALATPDGPASARTRPHHPEPAETAVTTVVTAAPPAKAPVAKAPSTKAPSPSKDPRCVALSEALKPVLQATCPEGAGGYGGALQANLHPADADVLGGVPLIRAALRRAARQLGWRVQTLGHEGERVAMVLVHDVREVPEEFADALEEGRMRSSAEAAERVAAVMGRRDPDALGPGPVQRQTEMFLGAAKAAIAANPEAWS